MNKTRTRAPACSPARPDAARRRLLAAAMGPSLLTTGCGKAGVDARPSRSVGDLGRYIAVPKNATGVQWAIMSLPEQDDGWFTIPGRTDYLSLVAGLRMEPRDRDNFLSELPRRRPPDDGPIDEFFHRWMSPEFVAGYRALWAETGNEARDASSLVRARCLFAAAGAYAYGAVVYVAYLAPNQR